MGNNGNINNLNRMYDARRGNYQGYLGAFSGRVESIGPLRDTMVVSYGPNSGREMPIQHPFVGSSSWIRSVPSTGTRYLMQLRGDNEQATPLTTLPQDSETRSVMYQKQRNLYRNLAGGEIDLVSSGAASIYLGEFGHVDLRSGIGAREHLNPLKLEHSVFTPTHRKVLVDHVAGQLGDEYRLGVVKRDVDEIDEKYIMVDENFQAERFLHLKNPLGSGPAVLLQETEGQVYDQAGVRVNHKLTNIPLRHKKIRYTDNEQEHNTEIDEKGNTLVQLPNAAVEGFQLDIPQGNYRKFIGINRELSIGKDEVVTVGEDIQYTVGGSTRYSVTKETIIDSSSNILELNPKEGSETASLLNKQKYGILSQNASDGGLTKITGPKSSTILMNGAGEVIATTGNNEYLKLTKDLAELVTSNLVRLKGTTARIDTRKVYLGEGAGIPAVMGLAMQSYIDTHVHTSSSPGSPTSPVTVPSASLNGTPQSILSTNIYLRANV